MELVHYLQFPMDIRHHNLQKLTAITVIFHLACGCHTNSEEVHADNVSILTVLARDWGECVFPAVNAIFNPSITMSYGAVIFTKFLNSFISSGVVLRNMSAPITTLSRKADCKAPNSSFVIWMGFKNFWHDLQIPLK